MLGTPKSFPFAVSNHTRFQIYPAVISLQEMERVPLLTTTFVSIGAFMTDWLNSPLPVWMEQICKTSFLDQNKQLLLDFCTSPLSKLSRKLNQSLALWPKYNSRSSFSLVPWGISIQLTLCMNFNLPSSLP